MGQRLNIEIKKQEKLLANAYYHWSGYSEVSLLLTKQIIDGFDKYKDENNDLIKAIKLLQETEAGITRETIHYLYKNVEDFDISKCQRGTYDYLFARSRNDGLIGVTEKEMKETRSWEEGRITIHIDTKTFDFEVFHLPSLEDFEEAYEIKIEDLPTLEFPIKNIKFEQIDEVLELVKKTQDTSNGTFKDPNGNVYGLIW